MDAHHFSAHIPLIKPDECLIKSGIEYELGKYVNDVRVDENCIVKAVIPRYREYGVKPPSHTVLVEYEKNGKIYIDIIEAPSYRSTHSFFGHTLEPTDILTNVSYNSPLTKGDILAKTASYGREGSYDYGLNANTVFMSHPSVSDDGIVISESFAKRAEFTSISKRVINISKNTIPLNLYGDKSTYKFLPEIGESLRPDGLLCAIRERNDWFSVFDLNDANLMQEDPNFDILTYTNVDSVVLDISVIKGNSKPEFSSKMTEQLDMYAAMLNNYHFRVIDAFEKILAEKKVLYGDSEDIKLTPRLHRYITDCYVKYNASSNRKYSLSYRKLPVDQYRIEVTTMSVIRPNLGYKLTDKDASKGVVTAILPDHHMPVDKNGVRADVITDSSSTISRMNIGRAYEAYIGATSRDNRARLINMLSSKFNGMYTSEAVEYARKYLRGLYELINSDVVAFLDSLNPEELLHHVREVIETNLYIYYPVDNEINVTDVVKAIEESIYAPLDDKIKYVNGFGELVESRDNIQVGVLYFMFLEKIANSYSAVSSSKVNNFGFPVKGANIDKPKYQHSQNPNKFMDETGTRILVSYLGEKAVADMVDLALNPSSHKALIRKMLESKGGYNNDEDINREDIPYGQTKSLQILNHVLTATGFSIDFVEEEN